MTARADVVAETPPTLDRLHVAKRAGEAVDQVRREVEWLELLMGTRPVGRTDRRETLPRAK